MILIGNLSVGSGIVSAGGISFSTGSGGSGDFGEVGGDGVGGDGVDACRERAFFLGESLLGRRLFSVHKDDEDLEPCMGGGEAADELGLLPLGEVRGLLDLI